MSQLRLNKKNEMGLFCTRCAHECVSLREYILHKKNSHYVRVVDTIESLKVIGIDDPELYTELLERFKNEPIRREYAQWAKEQLSTIMQPRKERI